ncbi:hypothetical protein BSQ39_11190 [Loigolactobacillus backii]|uniref:C4-dicarboxylate ABC transporter n=1 Tax=Loigolactobacillus backii TaxID=375175 RepID=A0A192GXX9_9LACO|nr:TDT family transporter [Loigolactobacillus backii]ANK58956.1 hypothetical protein AYR52_00930 [Loigolactobacillus backii]ANK61374.1 hypothetical protein AYR53_00555 [Loigolactobacillus backii]ANK63944.1 hypothetical protein AYR54_00915 [Loigolactobacillus backii]ANK66392.1 hypothetical protein AYR55_00920 [Loigolactobacillus backii]ANK69426.1 hypothetical protein AYR56_04160 [Loigolactobacillus backii]
MRIFLKSIPIPICGLFLAIASLGNLAKDYQLTVLANVLGLGAAVGLLFVILKLIFDFKDSVQALKDPIIASVAPNFSMAIMVLATYLTGFKHLASSVWYLGVIIQFGLMLYFTYYFVLRKKVTLAQVYPSWFIVYVGMGVIPMTSADFNPTLGHVVLWLAVVFYLILLPIVLRRVFKIQKMSQRTIPLVAVIAAPGSLCLAGYMKGFTYQSFWPLLGLLVLSQLMYFLVLACLPRLLQTKFSPSYAAFTFPLVITAIAITAVRDLFIKIGYQIVSLNLLTIVESIVAILIVGYVLACYVRYLYQENRSKVSEDAN